MEKICENILKCILILFVFVDTASCVIYHLNETEYSRMPPLFGLDEHEACVSRERGLYCVVRLDLVAEPGNQLMDLIQNYTAMTVKHYNYTYLERGVCVRETCKKYFTDDRNTTEDVEEILRVCLNESIYDQYGLQIKKPVIYYCDVHGETEGFIWLDWFVAAVCAALVLVNIASSMYDYHCNGSKDGDGKIKGNMYLLSFSLKRNWNWLVNTESSPQLQRLSSIYGLRTITTFLVVFSHALLTITTGFSDRTHDIEQLYEGHFMQIYFNGLAVVQIFFYISGFLLIYNLLLHKEKFSWKKIPIIMFLRWWRLSPVYAVILALSTTWVRFLATGPLWKLWVTNSLVADCRKYWWTHLLYINNYIFDDRYCNAPSWHVATDTQVFFVGLVVLACTVSKTRIPVLSALIVISVILPGLHVYFQDLDATLLLTPEFYRNVASETFRRLYILGHNNLTSFFIGMISGHFVHLWQSKGVDFYNNKVYSILLWFVVPIGALWLYVGSVFFRDAPRTSLFIRVLYQATHRGIISLFIAFAIIGLVMRCKNILRNILEWRGWVVPSRLSYCLYLVHFNLIHLLLGIRTQLGPPASLFFVWLIQMGIVLMSYTIALPLFLLVEAPFNRLMKTIMSRQKKL